MQLPDIIPLLPRPLRAISGVLPLQLVERPLRRLLRASLARHPGVLARLGPYADKRFLIVPSDLTFALLITPAQGTLTVLRQKTPVRFDARITGPLAAFLGLVHGAYDGDALFFSRDLVVEGDTGAVLALRNAIDDAEIDLARDVLAALGYGEALIAPAFQRTVPIVERFTGVALSRKTGVVL